MTENCPKCARKFRKLEDFPVIYLHTLERYKLPYGLKFHYTDPEVYVDAKSKSLNLKVPKEVEEFYNENEDYEIFEYKGWEWTAGKRIINKTYYRRQSNQKPKILEPLNSYLDTLEKFIGKETPTSHFLPQFNRDNYFNFVFDLPETGYHIMIKEREKTEKAIENIREADYIILGYEIDLNPSLIDLNPSEEIPFLKEITTIAKIEYEGRLLK